MGMRIVRAEEFDKVFLVDEVRREGGETAVRACRGCRGPTVIATACGAVIHPFTLREASVVFHEGGLLIMDRKFAVPKPGESIWEGYSLSTDVGLWDLLHDIYIPIDTIKLVKLSVLGRFIVKLAARRSLTYTTTYYEYGDGRSYAAYKQCEKVVVQTLRLHVVDRYELAKAMVRARHHEVWRNRIRFWV